MNGLLLVLLCLAVFAIAYRFYARFFEKRVLGIPENCRMPSEEYRDDVDYVPTRRSILFGHHFASIAGLSPIVGPAIAILWGWLPAILWVVLGSIFIGAIHDYSSLALSVRNRGQGIGTLTGKILGPRARLLFLLVIFFLLVLAMGVFVIFAAQLLTHTPPGRPGDPVAWNSPEAVLPSFGIMVIAVVLGFLHHRKGVSILWLTVFGVTLSLGLIALGVAFPIRIDNTMMRWILLGYAFVASVLPVWVLLQPRDYVNSFQLYIGLILLYLGIAVVHPHIDYPALRAATPAEIGLSEGGEPFGAVTGLPLLFPFLFITIACGACSGFHNLVSSGTTARQISKPSDVRPVGYLGMISEATLAVAVVVACVYGIQNSREFTEAVSSFRAADAVKLKYFVVGSAQLLERLGIPFHFGRVFISTLAISFALTTLDSGTRLLRFNFEALLGENIRWGKLHNRVLSSLLAVGSIGIFAFFQFGMTLWALFGTTNQLLAALGLLVVSVYLYRIGKPTVYTLVPMVFMLIVTLTAMTYNLYSYITNAQRDWLLIGTGGSIFVLSLWLLLEAFVTMRGLRTDRTAFEVRMNATEELG